MKISLFSTAFRIGMSQFIVRILFLPVFILFAFPVHPQFLEEFEDPAFRDTTPANWSYATGEGRANIQFIQRNGFASILVDATDDLRNIWWALVRRPVPGLDLEKLMDPDYELRVEARIKVSHAPRRVNLHFNHQRTTDYHSHLMEYDIPDTSHWHTISMTTTDFEVQPGDQINAQMALMDWGRDQYQVDLDYFKVDVVDRNTSGKDLGAKLPYHPPLADPDTFAWHLPVVHDAVIDQEYPSLNFNPWETSDRAGATSLLAVGGSQSIILRWNFESVQSQQVKGSGLLELITHSLERAPRYAKDFGMVRVCEILGGDPLWDQQTVSYDSFLAGRPWEQVVNSQMIIDYPVSPERGGRALFTIPAPVLNRLITGRTLGLAVLPLGAVHATFYASEHQNGVHQPRLHLSTGN